MVRTMHENIHQNQDPPSPIPEHALDELPIHHTSNFGLTIPGNALHSQLLVLFGEIPGLGVMGIIGQQEPDRDTNWHRHGTANYIHPSPPCQS